MKNDIGNTDEELSRFVQLMTLDEIESLLATINRIRALQSPPTAPSIDIPPALRRRMGLN